MDKRKYVLTGGLVTGCWLLVAGCFAQSTLEQDKEAILSQIHIRRMDATMSVLSSLYDRVMEYYEENRFKDAIPFLEKIVIIEPSYKGAEVLLEAIKKMAELPPAGAKKRVIDEYFEEGLALYQQGSLLRAVQLWEKILVLDPGRKDIEGYIQDARRLLAAPYYERGWRNYQKGEWDEAIRNWEMVLTLDPNYMGVRELITTGRERAREARIQTLYGKAEALFKADRLTEAETVVEQVLKIHPSLPEALSLKSKIDRRRQQLYAHYFGKGEKHFRRGEYTNAIKQWRRALPFAKRKSEVRAKLKQANYLLAQMEAEAKRREEEARRKEAEAEVQEEETTEPVVAADPEEIQRRYKQGLYYYQSGYLEKAISEWEAVLRMDPTNEHAYVNIQRAKNELQRQK